MSKVQLQPDTMLNPMPVILVSCLKEGAKPNLITLAWTGVACSKPPMISIAIRPDRFSHEIISQSGEFVIAVPNAEMIKAVDMCGTVSGRSVDKWNLTGLTPLAADRVKAPLVAEAPLNLECKVAQVLQLGAHDLFIAEVVAVHAEERVVTEKGGIDTDKSAPVVYCYGSHEYRALGRSLGRYGFSKRD